jgi:hypothetical protein
MNLRHAAALAGTWLLLTPPKEPRPFGEFRVMTEAPLSQWSTIGTFTTEDDCEVASHPKLSNGVPSAPIGSGARVAAESVKCVSSDDRRLKP